MTRWSFTSVGAASVLLATAAIADDKTTASKSTAPPPATVENRVKETDLTTIKLAPEAEIRLGIRTVEAQKRAMSVVRKLAGEVMVPAGRTIVVSAPVAGSVAPAEGKADLPAAWTKVAVNEPLMKLFPGAGGDGHTFTPADRISLAKTRADLAAARVDAAGQTKEADVRIEAAQRKVMRAEQLVQEHAGSAKAVEEARAELELAKTSAIAVKDRLEVLDKISQSLDAGHIVELPILAPIAGLVRGIDVGAGQIVGGGQRLLEIIDIGVVWIRVAALPGDWPELRDATEAQIATLGAIPTSLRVIAKRVSNPATASAAGATTDLFFEAQNSAGEWIPGQRVVVEVPSRRSGECMVVPTSAVLYDAFGGTWVYLASAARTYARRRVEITRTEGDLAIVARGLKGGENVVTDGAAELFGVEFGAGK